MILLTLNTTAAAPSATSMYFRMEECLRPGGPVRECSEPGRDVTHHLHSPTWTRMESWLHHWPRSPAGEPDRKLTDLHRAGRSASTPFPRDCGRSRRE